MIAWCILSFLKYCWYFHNIDMPWPVIIDLLYNEYCFWLPSHLNSRGTSVVWFTLSKDSKMHRYINKKPFVICRDVKIKINIKAYLLLLEPIAETRFLLFWQTNISVDILKHKTIYEILIISCTMTVILKRLQMRVFSVFYMTSLWRN